MVREVGVGVMAGMGLTVAWKSAKGGTEEDASGEAERREI